MKKSDIIDLLIIHFKNYNSKYFIDNINIDKINYNKYLLCLLKKDLVKIYKKIGDELSDKNLNKENKIFYVKILSKHFNNNTNEYFLNIINNTYYDNINYRNYLKCLSMKNITNIYANIHKNNKDEPEHISKAFKSSKSDSNIIPEIKYDIVDIPKNISVVSKSFKSSKKTYIKPKKIEKIYNEDIDIDYLPFNTKRVSDNKFEEKLNKIINKYKKKKSNIIKYIMRLSQLFLDDIIIMKDIYYKPMKIKIINVLYINVDTLLYIGEVIEGTTKGSKVVVKIQPKIPDKFEYRKIDIKYQITTEYYIMKLLNINCANAIVSKIYAYGYINELVEGDIERYVLVSEYLGKDLTSLKYEENILIIRDIFILILKALNSMHNCNLNKNISIVHRDIKPNNIVFTDNTRNKIKIIDFGLSTNVFNIINERSLKEYKGIHGTPYYMSIMQHKTFVIDYMDDLQAIAWMLLDILSKNKYILLDNINEKQVDKINEKQVDNIIYNNKINFLKNYKNAEYIKTIGNILLTENNISVIGEIVEYTMKRADKIHKYPTDKKTSNGIYYSDYNESYYNDIEKILYKLK
jgi:serine/threonine protein kinase